MYSVLSSKNNFNFIAKLIILYYAISPFLYLVRTISGDSGMSYFILRISEPVLLIAALFFCVIQRNIRLNAYAIALFFISIYGLMIALVQGNSKIDLMGGYFHFMTGVILFLYFSNTGVYLDLERVMKILSVSTITSCSLVIAFMYCVPSVLGIHIYLGLACQILIVVFFYNLHKRRIFPCIVTMLVIILSGKRGVFIALLCGFLISLVLQVHKAKLKNIVKVLVAVCLLSTLILVAFPMINERLIKKYSYSETSVDDYSAGRWNEVISAYDAWSGNIENVVLGSGFGFTYTYVYSGKKIADVEDYKNVHFSYLNPLIIFGIPVASIYYLCLIILILKLFYKVDEKISYLKWASLTYLIYACFVFDLFDEPILWMINGVLLSYRKSVTESSGMLRPTPIGYHKAISS